jgi:hypothetical protein
MMNPPGGKQSALMTPLAAREYSSAGSGQGGGLKSSAQSGSRNYFKFSFNIIFISLLIIYKLLY